MPEFNRGELFRSPEREKMQNEPVVRFSRPENDPEIGEEREKKYVAVAGVELEVHQGSDGSAFSDKEFSDFSFDEASIDILKRYAVAAKLGQPILIEGATDIGKTKAVEYLAHLTNHRLFRLSLSGQTDVTEFIGKYVPNTEDARSTFERIIKNRDKLSKGSQAILDAVDQEEGLRGLTEDECRVIAKNEGLNFGSQVNWVWQDGIFPKAMTSDGGKGAWLYLDEIGTAEPQVLVRINRMFEKVARLELAENGNRMVQAGPEFRMFASTNPPEYSGRLPLAPDALRRWTYQKMDRLPIAVIEQRLGFLFSGEKREVGPTLAKIGVLENTALDFKQERNKELGKVITEALVEFYDQLQKMVDKGDVGKDQRQKVGVEYSDLERTHAFLASFGGADPEKMLHSAINYYFVNKFGAAKDRQKVTQLLETVFRAKGTIAKIKGAFKAEKKSETPELSAAQQEAERLMSLI